MLPARLGEHWNLENREKCRQLAADQCIANGMHSQSQTETLVSDFSLRPNLNLNSV